MCECQNAAAAVATNLDSIGLLLNLFVLGITSSFSHCIGMCGAIAMSQASARMISDLPGKNHGNIKKIVCCAAWEYYLGKAITYAILTALVIALGEAIKDNYLFKLFKNFFLLLVILYFCISSLRVIFSLFNRKLLIPKIPQIKPFINIKIFKINLNLGQDSLSRLLIGVCLGLIPCGIVYSAVAVITANTKSIPLGVLAALVFGIGTFPGLFMISYSGNLILYRFKKLFDLAYLLTMLWNAQILISIL
jgi:sulfite exporter TauE/SafE